MGESSRLVTVTCLQHNRTLVSGLWNFLAVKNGLNCELNVGGTSLQAHRLVAEVFLSPDKLSKIDPFPLPPEVSHKIKPDDDSRHLDSLLEFLYTGRTTVQEGQLGKLLEVAREVDFRLLEDAVKEVQIDDDVKIDDEYDNFVTEIVKNEPIGCDFAPEAAEDTDSAINVDNLESLICNDTPIETIKVEVVSENRDIETTFESFRIEDTSSGIETGDRPSDGFSDSSKENGSKVAGPTVDGPADAGPTAGHNSSLRRHSQRQRKLPAKFLSSELDFHVDREWPTPARKRVKLVEPEQEPVSFEPIDQVEVLGPFFAADGDNGADGSDDRSHPDVSDQQVKSEREVHDLLHKYRCSLCDFQTNRETMFRIHMANHDPNAQVFHCHWCGKMFLSQVSLQGHRCAKAPSTKKMYTCSQCEFRNRDKAVYRVHLKSEHGIDVGPVFKCEECGRPFLSAQTMERHAADKHGWTPVDTFRCPHCKYETPKVWSYNHHLFTEHQINAKGDVLPRVKCDQCELTCKTQQDLQAHVLLWHQMQEGETRGAEVVVETTTPAVQLPQPTIMVQIADRSKMCGLCGYSAAATATELEEHKLSHVGSKNHRCDICGRTLSDRNTLRRHVLTHIAGTKLHGCHVCSYASNRRDNLRSHLRNVHKMTT